MSKISELSDGGSLQSTDYLIAVRSGGNVKVQADGNLSLGALTLTGLTVDTNTLHVDATNNRVGVGTTSPASPLEVVGSSAGASLVAGRLRNSGTTSGTGATLALMTNTNSTAGVTLATLDAVSNNTTGGGYFTIRSSSPTGNLLERLRIDSSGNVGIGTSSPNLNSNSRALTIQGSASAGLDLVGSRTADGALGQITFYNSSTLVGLINAARRGADNSSSLEFYTSNAGSLAERMRIDSSGNVGIGTTSPATRLELSGVKDTSELRLSSTTNDSSWVVGEYFGKLSFYSADSSGAGAGVKGSIVTAQSGSSGATPYMTFNVASTSTNDVERMRIDSSGDVGIGTSSLSTSAGYSTLSLSGSTGAQLAFQTGGTGKQYIYSTSTDLNIYNSVAGNLIFHTSGSEAMRIDSSGNLLVGATSQIGVEKFGVDSGSGAAGKFKGGNSTNVTIDVWNPATSGDNIFVAFRTETAETTRGTITYNRIGGLVAYNTTSDYRAKDIIGPVQNTGATIDALKVYEGKMKGATQSRPMLVAHEAQEHTPYAVSGVKDEMHEDGTPKFQQIDVSSLVPLLIAEIQSLRARVAQLEGA